MTSRASGTFDVTLKPQAADDKAEDATLGRMSIDKKFHGDIDGTGKGQMLAAGTAVTLVLRPESINISTGGTGLRGTIVSRTFLGEKVEYHVRVDGDTLQVTDYGAGGARVLAPGEAVTLGVPATGVWLLGGGE